MRWHQFVKVDRWDDEGLPYYIQWGVWCWRKPLWIGLPLIWLAAPMLAVDLLYMIVMGLVAWAKHR